MATAPFFDDRDELKEVYEPSGAGKQFLEIETAFRYAGYQVQSSELSPHRPVAVVVLHVSAGRMPIISDHARLMAHAIQILRQTSIWFNEADVNVRPQRKGALISFLWEPPVVESIQGMDLDELLKLLP